MVITEIKIYLKKFCRLQIDLKKSGSIFSIYSKENKISCCSDILIRVYIGKSYGRNNMRSICIKHRGSFKPSSLDSNPGDNFTLTEFISGKVKIKRCLRGRNNE